MANYERCTFLLQQKSAGTNTGTATVTVENCSTQGGSGNVAMPFRYRKKTSGLAADDYSAMTAATAAGFTTTANEDTIYEIEVDARDTDAAKPYVRLKLTQVVADAVDGSVVALLSGPQDKQGRYVGNTQPTVLT